MEASGQALQGFQLLHHLITDAFSNYREGYQMFCTYAHYTKDTNAIFYIGKGSEKRARALCPTHRSTHWNRVKDKHGVKVEIIARWSLESEAFEHEKFLISTLRSIGVKLVNASDGGAGGSAGAIKSPEHRAKIGAAHKGRFVSEETLERMRQAAIRQFANPEARELARKNQTGKKQSAESSAKKSLALRGKKQTPEAIATRTKAIREAALIRKQNKCLI